MWRGLLRIHVLSWRRKHGVTDGCDRRCDWDASIAMAASAANSRWWSYKVRKEEFVSNLDGTSMVEVAVLSALVPGFMVLGQIVVSSAVMCTASTTGGKRQQHRRLWGELVRSLGIELTVAVIPILACLTVLAESVNLVLAALVCVLLGCFLLLRPHPQQSSTAADDAVLAAAAAEQQQGGGAGDDVAGAAAATGPTAAGAAGASQRRHSFLSAYRCAMMLVTCITILAVDFTVYPRRLAKTETYGTGLMDVGVGSFVVANALVSRQSRGLPPPPWLSAVRQTSPLLVLGLLRLLLTKGVDYPVHVAEYGVHWNFFFTLAGVTLLTSVIRIPARASGLLGVVVLVAYQAWLSSGLNEYLLSPERGPGLVSLNKEGVYSTLGYWGLYLVSVHLGYLINRRTRQPGAKSATAAALQRWRTALEVCGLAALLWMLAAATNGGVDRVSRRTCNLAYVLLVLGQNLQVMGGFALAEAVVPLRNMVWMDAFDRNLLPTFLLANVLTGLVNLGTDTLAVAPAWAFPILVLYVAFLAGGMSLLDAFQLKLKFW